MSRCHKLGAAEFHQCDLDGDARLWRPLHLRHRLVQARDHARQDLGREELGLILQYILWLGVEVHGLDGARRLEDHEAAQVQR